MESINVLGITSFVPGKKQSITGESSEVDCFLLRDRDSPKEIKFYTLVCTDYFECIRERVKEL